MKNNLKNNLKINLIITILTSALSFVSNKYFSEYMGIETLGLMRLFTQIIAYLNLADMGIGTASTYALYKPLIEKNNQQVSVVVSTIDFFYKRIAFIILIIGLIFNIFLHFFIECGDYGKILYIYWSLYVINTSISYVYAKYPILFTANQEYQNVRLIQGSGKIIFQIFQIIFLIKTQSFLLFIVLMILENIYLFILYKKHYKKNYKIFKAKIIDKNIIKDSKNLFWHKFATVIVFNTDYIILSKYMSLITVGVYSSYLIIYQVIIVFIRVVSNVLTPSIGKFIAENPKQKIYEKWNEIYLIYFYISTFLIICTYNLILPFIKLWLGDEYVLPKITIFLILLNLFIQMIREVTEIFKTGSGFFDDTYVPFLEGVLNLICSLILVKKIGLNGVILGTLISNVAIIMILKPILVFKRCFSKTGLEYIKITIYYFFLVGISILISQPLINNIKLNNITDWNGWIITASLISLIVVVVVSIVFLINREFRIILIKILKLNK